MTDRIGPDTAPRGTNISYVPALDGIRGVGMLNILGVHAGVWLTGGGFYNLDSFFALSGFLITSLLIAEWRKRDKIRLGTFWAQRARRLLPGLFLMLLGPSFVFGVLVPAGTYPSLRR
jgi:peptidoglycan/LPS O-acetylase OafA/YrhL